MGIILVYFYLNWMSFCLFLILMVGRHVVVIGWMFFVVIPRRYKDVYVKRFCPCTVRLWNSLQAEWFPLTYDLNGLKSRVH